MTPVKTTKNLKGFDELRKQIDADPARRANVEKHKTAMLGELRRKCIPGSFRLDWGVA